jgi:hypothetical protein
MLSNKIALLCSLCLLFGFPPSSRGAKLPELPEAVINDLWKAASGLYFLKHLIDNHKIIKIIYIYMYI